MSDWNKDTPPLLTPELAREVVTSRLERIATAAMQGDLANPGEGCWAERDAEQLAQRAVTFARALIAELDKGEG